MPKTQVAAEAAPTVTFDANDPLAPGLLRFSIGAARARGGYPPATLRLAERTLQDFQEFRERQGRRR